MDPLTIAAILSAVQAAGGIAGMFRKKPKYPAYQPRDTEALKATLKQDIGESARESLGTLSAGAIRRGFGQSGQMGQIARDVEIASNKDYSRGITGIESQEADRYMNYLLGKYGAQSGQYQSESQGYGSMFGGGVSNLMTLLMNRNQGGGTGMNAWNAARRSSASPRFDTSLRPTYLGFSGSRRP